MKWAEGEEKNNFPHNVMKFFHPHCDIIAKCVKICCACDTGEIWWYAQIRKSSWRFFTLVENILSKLKINKDLKRNNKLFYLSIRNSTRDHKLNKAQKICTNDWFVRLLTCDKNSSQMAQLLICEWVKKKKKNKKIYEWLWW